MPCRGEQSLIEAFVPQPLIEAFHESILCRRGGGCERKFAVEIFIVVIVVAVVLWLVGRSWIGSGHSAAMALASRTAYQPRPVMGREEAFLFYKLENWVNLGKLRHDVEQLQAQVLDARAERMDMERNVHALRSASLDPDLLEERARTLLGYGHAEEWVVIIKPSHTVRAVADLTPK
jgi:hypothetical protein